MSKPEILVAESTTAYGAAVAHALLQLGSAVRAMTSDLAHPAADALRRRGAQLAWCPPGEDAAVQDALDGIAIVCAGAYESNPSGEDTAQSLALVDAAAHASVEHFIYSSHAAACARTGVPQFDGRHEVERFLRASGLHCTILCPAFFMEELLQEPLAGSLRRGVLPLGDLDGHALQLTALDDAVRFLRIVVQRLHEYDGRRLVIASDELTAIEMAAVLARTFGRGLQVSSTRDANAADVLRQHAAAPRADVMQLRRLHPEVNWHTLEGWAQRQSWSARRAAQSVPLAGKNSPGGTRD